MKRTLTLTLLPAAVLLSAAFNQALANTDYVSFYNKDNGVGAATTFSRNDAPTTTDVQGFSTGWSQIVRITGGVVLYYNHTNGVGAVAYADGNGGMTTANAFHFSANLSIITAHRGYLMFYDKTTGHAVVGQISSNGSNYVYHQFPTVYRFSPGWTQIVSTNNGLVFYNSKDGSGAVGDWVFSYTGCTGLCGPSNVTFKQKASYAPGTLTEGWTQIVETGAGVLFYRASDGVAATVDIDAAGTIITRANTQEYLSPGWSAIVASGNDILFYNKVTGDGAVGHLVQAQETLGATGLVHTDQSLPHLFSTGWTSVYPISVPTLIR